MVEKLCVPDWLGTRLAPGLGTALAWPASLMPAPCPQGRAAEKARGWAVRGEPHVIFAVLRDWLHVSVSSCYV